MGIGLLTTPIYVSICEWNVYMRYKEQIPPMWEKIILFVSQGLSLQ